jgi:hypothetical protein
MLVQLIYASTPVDASADFVSRAQEKNTLLEITGLLVSSKTLYLQVLEGTRENVNRLYETIVKDVRHRDVFLLRYADVRIREFSNWTMQRVSLESLGEFSDTPTPTPSTISSAQALAFLRRAGATLNAQQNILASLG